MKDTWKKKKRNDSNLIGNFPAVCAGFELMDTVMDTVG